MDPGRFAQYPVRTVSRFAQCPVRTVVSPSSPVTLATVLYGYHIVFKVSSI